MYSPYIFSRSIDIKMRWMVAIPFISFTLPQFLRLIRAGTKVKFPSAYILVISDLIC